MKPGKVFEVVGITTLFIYVERTELNLTVRTVNWIQKMSASD
jgi:hypothetical protein